jgi:hypothetical protein
MPSFNWLHLTDLHFGLSDQPPLWPNIREAFFNDLAELRDRCGPWHAVLFTGDFVQSGSKDQYQELEKQVLRPLWDRLHTLESGGAVLLAVPGNHDLTRPDHKKPSAALSRLLDAPGQECSEGLYKIEGQFWSESDGEYRKVITDAFRNYVEWWTTSPSYRGRHEISHGALPGDFSTTLEFDGNLRIGIIGLNTTFLQLAGGDYQGRLAWNVRQFNAAADGGNPNGNGPGWTQQHDACLLLTHQGRDWLDKTSREEAYPEINPAGRFAVHLFGHMHENVLRTFSQGGGKSLRQWQGPSLFGMEKYGDPPRKDRRHGYSLGRIEVNGDVASIRVWPRLAKHDAVNGWRLIRDEAACVLELDGGTRPEQIEVLRRAKSVTPRPPVPAPAAPPKAGGRLWSGEILGKRSGALAEMMTRSRVMLGIVAVGLILLIACVLLVGALRDFTPSLMVAFVCLCVLLAMTVAPLAYSAWRELADSGMNPIPQRDIAKLIMSVRLVQMSQPSIQALANSLNTSADDVMARMNLLEGILYQIPTS